MSSRMESAALSVVGKVGQVLVDELKDISGVGNKVVQLRDELATMNAVLRVISEAEQDSVDHLVREWENQVHDLVYDAEDCTDTYLLRIARPLPRPPNDVAGGKQLIFAWARYLLSRAKRVAGYPYKKLVLQRALAADIKDLLVRTTAVSERRARYNIDQATLPRAAFLAPVSAASISANSLRRADNPHQFVGITEQAKGLANKIRDVKGPAHHKGLFSRIRTYLSNNDDEEVIHDEDDRSLKVLSIVGFGGLGKTTLAMELCRQLDSDFPSQAMVPVSQAFNVDKGMEELLGEVLKQLTKADEQRTNQMEVDTRRLIVIDDVWSVPAWEAIRIKLLEKFCGSKIIVTTRIEAVAKVASVSEDYVHRVSPLEPNASKELFKKRVFGSMDACPNGIEDVIDKILKKCGGLPLAIVSIASLLASYSSAEGIETIMWDRVSRSIGSHMESHPTLEGMRQLITVSYDYLPHHLKACMMYLSSFREDYMIAKDKLLYRWIAEGLVSEKRGLTLLEVAEEYFNELISRNMIQPDKVMFHLGNYREVEVEGCRVHDMILEVMVSKSYESNFVSLIGQQFIGMPHGGNVRRLSIHDNNHEEQHHSTDGVEAMKLQHVRSLTTFQRDGLDKLLDRLGEFKLLRVLDLEDCKSVEDKHMRDVCQLYLLRFLSLRGTSVKIIPRKISNLKHLETLDVEQSGIGELPQTVTKLSKLKRLRSSSWTLPPGLGNMKALCEVDMGLLNVPSVAQEIGNLPQLQVLCIKIGECIDDGSLKNLASSLSKASALRVLNLYEKKESNTGSLRDFLGVSMQLPPLLQCLGVFGCISELPHSISTLTHLTKLEVGSTKLVGGQMFPVLGKLPNLQSIHLVDIRCQDDQVLDLADPEPEHSFPVLRTLKLLGCECYIQLTFVEGSMEKLETIVLDFRGMQMHMTIDGVNYLKNLKEVRLRGKKGHPPMKHAVKQLKTVKSRHIKVVEDWYQ